MNRHAIVTIGSAYGSEASRVTESYEATFASALKESCYASIDASIIAVQTHDECIIDIWPKAASTIIFWPHSFGPFTGSMTDAFDASAVTEFSQASVASMIST